MNKDNSSPGYAAIKGRIEAEKRAGLDFFEHRDFRRILEPRLDEDTSRHGNIKILQALKQPLFAVGIVFGLVALVSLYFFLGRSSRNVEPSPIRIVLDNNSRILTDKTTVDTDSAIRSSFHDFQWSVRRVLLKSRDSSSSRKPFAESLTQVLIWASAPVGGSSGRSRGNLGRGLYRELEMLRKSKSYYRFFCLILSNIKEL